MAGNHTGISSSTWKWKQAFSILLDVQVWIFFCTAFIQSLPGGGLTTVRSFEDKLRINANKEKFNKLILTGLGFTNIEV